jgi:hypothetical protein
MIALVVFLTLTICALLVYLLWLSHDQEPAPPVDPEQAYQTAAELHAIRRRLDVAELRHRQRQEARRVRREIAEALDDDAP